MKKTVFLFTALLFAAGFNLFADDNEPDAEKHEPTFEISLGIIYEIPLSEWHALRIGAFDFRINLYHKNNFFLFTGFEIPQWMDISYAYIGYVTDSNIYFGVNYKIPLFGQFYLVPALTVHVFPVYTLVSLLNDEDFVFPLGINTAAALEFQITDEHIIYLKSGIGILTGFFEGEIPFGERFNLKIPIELGYSFRF